MQKIIGIQVTDEQEETFRGLVEIFENHDVWIDPVTPGADDEIYVLFTHPTDGQYAYAIETDGTTGDNRTTSDIYDEVFGGDE